MVGNYAAHNSQLTQFHTDIRFPPQCGRGLLCTPHKATFASAKTLNRGNTPLAQKLPLKIKISWQHDHVANGHAAWPSQHEHYHVRHFTSLEQAS
jgi:hypothetical protein